MKTDDPITLLAHDCVHQGQVLAVEHLIKVYTRVKGEIGGDAPVSVDQVIEQLNKFKGQIEKNGG